MCPQTLNPKLGDFDPTLRPQNHKPFSRKPKIAVSWNNTNSLRCASSRLQSQRVIKRPSGTVTGFDGSELVVAVGDATCIKVDQGCSVTQTHRNQTNNPFSAHSRSQQSNTPYPEAMYVAGLKLKASEEHGQCQRD